MFDSPQSLASSTLSSTDDDSVVEQPIGGTDNKRLLGNGRLAAFTEHHHQRVWVCSVPGVDDFFRGISGWHRGGGA